tara:strand:+ start:602 stop:2170 length:1569 start_codon:yes stop_codon:yes gene_type:complete
MQLKKLTLHYKKYTPILLLSFFSFFVNYYYGFIGVMPSDNFVLYNGGYRVLSGYTPFNDYWLITGPLLDYLNAFFFLINGVSWKSYIIHSSLFNLILSLSTYFLFLNLGLKKNFSFFYSIIFSVLFYPIVGTPFVDHHSTLFLILGFYLLIFGINNKNPIYFMFIPFLFCLSFLSKQTPAVYGLFGVSPLFIIFLAYKKKEIKNILLYISVGSLISLLFLILFFYFTGIKITNFYDQYILFAKTIGENRYSNINFNLIEIVDEFKIITILLSFLIFIFIKLCKNKNRNINSILSILAIIVLTCVLAFHQRYTFNQNYIFFLIPLLTGIIHIFYKKIFINKIPLIFIILMCVYASTKYHIRFNENRKFNELEKVDLSKAIDAKVLSKDLKKLKWITYSHPDNPTKEIENLKKVMSILSEDKSNKVLITDYQFIAPSLKIYDYSPNQWHHPSVSFPTEGQKYYEKYKYFFIKSLKKNDISFIYETSNIDDAMVELVLSKDCFVKKRLTEMLIKFTLIKSCKDFL